MRQRSAIGFRGVVLFDSPFQGETIISVNVSPPACGALASHIPFTAEDAFVHVTPP